MRNKKVYEAHYIVGGARFKSIQHAAAIAALESERDVEAA